MSKPPKCSDTFLLLMKCICFERQSTYGHMSMTILVINFYYPLYAGVGANRVLRFRRYLRKAGMNVYILTPLRGRTTDEAEFVDVPQITKKLSCVYRTRDASQQGKSDFRSFSSKLLKYVSIHDRQIYWLPFAINEAIRIL